MFKIEYKIISNDYDDFIGQNGFFRMLCNGFAYGEIYHEELESVMDKVSIVDWFERLIKVIEHLNKSNYVALSDTESYNTWIEFKKRDENLVISIIQAKKEDGSHDIEYQLNNTEDGEWVNQIVSYKQLYEEILSKAKEYLEYIISQNHNEELFENLKSKLQYYNTVMGKPSSSVFNSRVLCSDKTKEQ